MKRIRMATPNDARQISEIYGPIVAETAISFESEPPNENEIASRIEKTLLHAPWLVCEEEGILAGYAYASRFRERAAYRWSVEVSVYVRDTYRRNGVARALYSSLLSLLRLQGFVAAFAGIALPNEASVKLHERIGFKRIGLFPKVGFKLGAWRDVGWWQLELRPHQSQPTEPMSIDKLMQQDDFAKIVALGECP